MIEEIELLGKKVDSLWQEKKGQFKFFEIAAQALKAWPLRKYFCLEEFLDDLWKRKELPQQLDPAGKFGSPPITLYRTNDFVIDVYFWVTPDISIHSHNFQGAFTVLQGLSLQSQYHFVEKQNLNDRMLIGDLSLSQTKLLHPGDVEEILGGPEFIHQVWHLSYPTVSLAVRTFEPEGTLYAYLEPHLAFRPHEFPSPTLQKQIYTLLMLHRIHQPEENHLLQLASSLEPDQAFALVRSYFAVTGDISLIERIVERLPKLEEWAPFFLTSLRHSYETAFDMTKVSDLGERFFLALLKISSTREQSERLFQTVFPNENFEEAVLRWFKSLMQRQSFRFELNETAQDVFAFLFQGSSEDEICRQLSQIYEVENNEDFQRDIRHFCNELRSRDFLKPFLSESQLSRFREPKAEALTSNPLIIPRLMERSVSTRQSILIDPKSTEYFNEKGYWILRQAINPWTLELIFNYFFLREKNTFGLFDDNQVQGAKSAYADPLCESLLLHLQPVLEEIAGKKLFPTYSFARIYGHSSVLNKHRDRPSCEISATLTVGYQAPTLWPLLIQLHGETVKVELDKGDLLLYKGCELMHWREPFEGNYWLQVFLHYVDAEGKYAAWKYDKRKEIGKTKMVEMGVRR